MRRTGERGTSVAGNGNNKLPKMNSAPEVLKSLPNFGFGSIAGYLLIGGFLLSLAYTAWKQGDKFKVPTRDFLAIIIVLAFVIAIGLAFTEQINEGRDILIGALIAAFSAIVAMYFKAGGEDE